VHHGRRKPTNTNVENAKGKAKQAQQQEDDPNKPVWKGGGVKDR